MEAHVGGDQLGVARLVRLHVGVGRLDPRQRRCVARLGGERGRLRLENAPELQHVADEHFGRRGLHVPGEEIGVEHVPVGLRPHHRADLLARDDQALGLERAERLAQRRPRHAEAHQQARLVRQARTWRIEAGDDFAAERGGERVVDVALGRDSPVSSSPRARTRPPASPSAVAWVPSHRPRLIPPRVVGRPFASPVRPIGARPKETRARTPTTDRWNPCRTRDCAAQ